MTNEQLNRRDAARISVENRIMKTVEPTVDLSKAKFDLKLTEWISKGMFESGSVKRELRPPGMLSMAPVVREIETVMTGMFHGEFNQMSILIVNNERFVSCQITNNWRFNYDETMYTKSLALAGGRVTSSGRFWGEAKCMRTRRRGYGRTAIDDVNVCND